MRQYTISRHCTKEQRKGYVEAYKRILKRCRDGGLPPPSVGKTAGWIGIATPTLITYLREFNVPIPQQREREEPTNLEVEA